MVHGYAFKLDGRERELIVSPQEIEAAVACDDACPGTNLILPTRGMPRHTGGLGAGKFIKVLARQRATPESRREAGAASAHISCSAGMAVHARFDFDRLHKYLPNGEFTLGIQ